MASLKKELYADVWRIYGKANMFLLLKAFLFKLAFRPIFTYRLYKSISAQPKVFKCILLPLVKLFHNTFSALASVSQPLKSEVGPGLLFVHGFGIVINSKAKLGRNVTLFHQNTIGETKKGAPIIEDNVILAAGAMVLGPIRVDSGATIGAATIVMKDVKALEVVVGNPQKVLRVESAPRTPNPAPDYLLG